MKLSEAINYRIQYYMKLNNLDSFWDLYKVTGVPKATINSFLSYKKT